MAAPIAANSSLSLYAECPPGLGGPGCLEGTCASPFVAPASRGLKADNATSCTSCDAGFGGINCNVCQGVDSCDTRQKISGHGVSGIVSGEDRGILGPTYDHSLTCHHQPNAVTSTYMECDVVHPTVNSVFPGRIALTLTKTGMVENNFTASGLAPWEAKANTTLTSFWIDGQEQFYCQASDCSSSNTTTSIDEKARFGTENWSCSNLQCFCIPTSSFCSNPNLPLKPVIDGLSGKLDLPCDYVDPTDPGARTSCAFKGGQLTQFLGAGGLPLKNCQFGACISRGDLRTFWAHDMAHKLTDGGYDLSPGVIAGLAILGLAVAGLAMLVLLGLIAQRRAAALPRAPKGSAVGLSWENLHYRINLKHTPLAHASGKKSNSTEDGHELFDLRGKATSWHPSETINVVEPPSARGEILRGISSCVAPGCLKFVMGASGAGKSTLVDILGGRDMQGKVEGSVFFIGKENEISSEVRRRIAFVDQEDAMAIPGYMTVRETLMFAAELSNPENVSKSEKAAIVDDVIHMLGLNAVANRRVGDLRRRGISGGERRRTSLGVAMVSRPKVLIADECTSGLDAYSAYRVITALRHLASGPETGTTVLVTIHQPSSELFYMADSVLVMDHGRTLYDGSPANALAFCESVGEPVTLGHNVADKLLIYAFKQHIGEAAKPPSFRESFVELGIQPSLVKVGRSGNSASTTAMTQTVTLLRRYLKMTRREYSGPLAHVGGAVILGLITGGSFYQVSLSIGGFQNRVGAIFFLYILLMTMCISALTGLNKLRFLMMRERATGMYSPGCWVAAHLVYDLLFLRIVPATLMTVIVYWMAGMHNTITNFLQFLLVTIVFTVVMSLYDMCLAALFEDMSSAIIVAGLYVIFNIGLAGFVLNLKKMPGALRWLKWIVPSKYALEAVAVNEVRGLQIIDNLGGVKVVTDASMVANTVFSFDFGAYYRNLIILGCGFTVAYSLVLFAAVQWRMKEKR